jgi:UDP-glucuronate decarboxylase
MIEGFVRFMALGDRFPGPMNLGNPVETTIGELAEKIVAMTWSRSRIVNAPTPVDDPVRRCPDITLARTKLGWEPRVPLDEGLRRTIAFFDRQLTAGRVPAAV